MRRVAFLIVSVVVALATSSFAQDPSGLPGSLKGTMKAMSSDLKKVSSQANKPELNENSATLAEHFVLVTLHSKEFSLGADFDKMIDETADLGTRLANAFKANDNAEAVKVLNQLVQIKKDGHREFNQ